MGSVTTSRPRSLRNSPPFLRRTVAKLASVDVDPPSDRSQSVAVSRRRWSPGRRVGEVRPCPVDWIVHMQIVEVACKQQAGASWPCQGSPQRSTRRMQVQPKKEGFKFSSVGCRAESVPEPSAAVVPNSP